MAKSTKSGLAARFTLADEEFSRRVIATLEGPVGVGKNHFAFTAPDPIVVFDSDLGCEGVVEKFRKDGKQIYHEKYNWTPHDDTAIELSEGEAKDMQEFAKELRDKFEQDIRYAALNGARSLIVDTESRFWEIYRYAEFGSPNGSDMKKDYPKLNAAFESHVNFVKATAGVNLFLIRSDKPKWDGYVRKGTEVWGYDHLPKMVGMELTFAFRSDKELKALEAKDEDNASLGNYVINIGKCRYNPELQFTTISRCTFPEFGAFHLEPGTSEEEWQ